MSPVGGNSTGSVASGLCWENSTDSPDATLGVIPTRWALSVELCFWLIRVSGGVCDLLSGPWMPWERFQALVVMSA